MTLKKSQLNITWKVMGNNSQKPLVAVWSLVYNHEPYLRDYFEGIIMQNTNFPFIAIVHDDCSTDGSAAIIKEYAEKYPDIIKPIFETENQYSKQDGSLDRIMCEAINASGAKYIALCEGDDYWTDPLKLQKQVDFLESNPKISYTCTRYKTRNDCEATPECAPNIILDKYKNLNGFEFDLEYAMFTDWVCKTLTAVFRTDALVMPKYNFARNCEYYRDIHMVYNILSKGNGYCFQFYSGVYRKQDTGVWSQKSYVDQICILINIWKEIYNLVPNDFNYKRLLSYQYQYYLLKLKSKEYPLIKTLKNFNFLIYSVNYYLKYKIGINVHSDIKRIANLSLNKRNHFGMT